MSASPIFVGAYKTQQTIFTSADSTNFVKICDGATSGVRIHAIVVTQTDGTSRDVVCAIGDDASGTNKCGLGAKNVPGNAGQNDSTAPVSLLDQLKWDWLDDSPGRFMVLGPNATLWLKLASSLSSNQVEVTVFYGDY